MLCFVQTKRFLISVAFLVMSIQIATGYYEFCTGSKLYKVKYKDCPGGVIFQTPIEMKCNYPNSLVYTTDICTGEKFDPSGATGTGSTTLQMQVLEMTNDDDPVDITQDPYQTQTCHTNAECAVVEEVVIDSMSSPPADADEMIASSGSTFGSEERDNEIEGVVTNDQHVKEQTQRVLMYLNSLIIDEDEQGPRLRIVEVLKKSFTVLRQHCPVAYVPEVFGEQVLKAFLFLVREGDLASLKDINEDDFANIMSVLNNCGDEMPAPIVKFNGKECQTRGIIYNITQENKQSQAYILRRNELSFRWGKYDPPVDATWGVADFVHGLCYGKFKDNVNKHHLYQRAMESIFTPEIVYRWARPFKLNVPEAWDHALRASMKDVMKNLEGCIQGAYIGSPFLHRLERPMARDNLTGIEAPKFGRRRKRRSVVTNLDASELSGSAYCMQDAVEKQKLVDAIKLTTCDPFAVITTTPDPALTP